MAEGESILYTTDDGAARVSLRMADGTAWLSQAKIAELFQITMQNVSLRARNVLAEGELLERIGDVRLTEKLFYSNSASRRRSAP